MEILPLSRFMFDTCWKDWQRGAACLASIGVIMLIGAFRISTHAEFAFASLVVLPVLVIAWVGGVRNGLIVALLAAAMWVVADIAIERQFSAPWIPWANAVTWWVTYSMVAFLAAQVHLQFEREHELASRDALTGLDNRRSFLDAGTREVERSKRYKRSLAVVFLDLDDFKQLNDNRGHAVGDAALRTTGKTLLDTVRSSDRVARLGGDEFAILLPEIGYNSAVEAGRKLSVAVHTALQEFAPVTCSIGIAWFGEIDRSFTEMLNVADRMMYDVKASGKHDVHALRFPANRWLPTASV